MLEGESSEEWEIIYDIRIVRETPDGLSDWDKSLIVVTILIYLSFLTLIKYIVA